MKKRRLPTGIQTFRELREADCYYVDKTAHVRRLVAEGKHYFLSRPRRFGKSLLLDMVKELFEGNEALFRGLRVHRHWDWTVRHPVLRLDFSGAGGGPEALRANLMQQLDDVEEDAGLTVTFFAAIPYNWHVNNPVAGYEGYYASVFYAHFAAAGLDVATEDASSRGRLDMAVRAVGRVYLFEFKMVDREPEGKAVAQLRERRYADKYRHLGEAIHLVGVEFSRETRNVAAFTVEPG